MTAINNTGTFQSEHEVVLQGFSQWLPFPDTNRVPGGRVFYHADAFAPTADAWNEVPILFVPPGLKPVHPDHDALSRDPVGTAKAHGMRIAGRLNNTRVTGSQMIADAVLSDPQAAELAKDNRLGLSTGFDAQINNAGRISGRVVPNHVLVFLKCGKTAGVCGTGNDPVSQFNNIAPADRFQVPKQRSKDLSPWIEEQQRTRDANRRHNESSEEGAMLARLREENRERDAQAVEMIKARGKLDPFTGQFRDFQSCEGPDS